MDHDTLYIKGLMDAPDIRACLIHADIPCVETFEAGGDHASFQGVTYGLCTACVDALEIDPNYRDTVAREINRRLKNLTRH